MRKRKKAQTGDQPDFILKMKSRDRKKKGAVRIGAGWLNSAGGIGIKLNMGVVLSYRDGEDYIFTLWPTDDDDFSEDEDEGEIGF
jgi:hypothetical protein